MPSLNASRQLSRVNAPTTMLGNRYIKSENMASMLICKFESLFKTIDTTLGVIFLGQQKNVGDCIHISNLCMRRFDSLSRL